MDLERRRLCDRLLARALERDPGERSAFIERECNGDAKLKSFVLRLAELAESSPGEPLFAASHGSGPPSQLVGELVDDCRDRATVSPGTEIGPYRVRREIGRGGMGVVYQGERIDGHFDQTVALKLLPRDGESGDALDRFERERQILAHLVHSNIAHLLDGGVTSDGVPYFAMEYSRHPERILRLRARLAVLGGDSATAESLFRELLGAGAPPGRGARAFARDCLDLARLLRRRHDPETARWLRLADRLLRRHVLPSHPDLVLVTRLLDESERAPEAATVSGL